MYYRIGEFARLGAVSIKALRFYDRIGLLQPAAVDPRTRYRLYRAQQLQDLAAILALKNLGASLRDIQGAVGRSTYGEERRRLLERLRANAERSIDAARQSLIWINNALNGCGDVDCAIPIIVKQRPEVRVASMRAQLRCYAEIGELERDLRRVVSPPCAGGLQGVLWHRCEEAGAIEGEPFIQVDRRTPRSRRYELKDLPAVTVATAYCESTDQAAVRTYEAISRWLQLHDYRLAGPKREIYVGQILEIQFPVRYGK